MRRLAILLLATTAMASLSVGSAASLRVWSHDLATGVFAAPQPARGVAEDSAPVVQCSLGEVVVALQRDAETPELVTSLTINHVPSGCEGLAVALSIRAADVGLTNARGVLEGTPSQRFDLDEQVPYDSIVATDVFIID